MIKVFRAKLLVIIFLSGILGACEKEEGKGGLSTIKGRVYAFDVDRLGNKVDSGYMADVRVFISYGNHTWVDNDTRTSFDGSFAFEWLNKGDYKVWLISECDTCHLNQRADIRQVNIDKKKETVTVSDLIYYY